MDEVVFIILTFHILNIHQIDLQIIKDANEDKSESEMPLLVYLAREKRPFHPHHFKAGALNVLVNFFITIIKYTFIYTSLFLYNHS